MRRSTDRIVTTHTGSLPRPNDLVALLLPKDGGQSYDAAALAPRVCAPEREVVHNQAAIGIHGIRDAAHSQSSFTAYLRTRLAGLSQTTKPYQAYGPTRDYIEFKDVYDENAVMLGARPSTKGRPLRNLRNTACMAPLKYVGQKEVAADIEYLKAALATVKSEEGFITALSPSNLEVFYRNEYYRTEDEYLAALADAMHEEYRAIADAGFVLQIDDPRLVTHWDRSPDITLAECRKFIAKRVEVLNHALRGIPEDQVRFHTCYSTNIAPRAHDMELKDYIDLMLKIRARAFSFEASNPRHEHEWEVWAETKLPDGIVLAPGVVSHCVSLVEHPELVAQRITRYANIVGRENVVACTDCGFGTSAVGDQVHPDVAWAKLKALVDGARIASKTLWR